MPGKVYEAMLICGGLIERAVFEGASHPYKRNLIKFDGKTRDEKPIEEKGAPEKTCA